MNYGIVHAIKDDLVMLAIYAREENKVVYNGALNINLLAKAPMQMGFKPLNFSVENGNLVQDVGKFSRLNAPHKVFIVLAELRSQGGRCLGYRCLEAGTCRIGNIKREDIISQQSQIKTRTSMLQNAIIRDGKVNCYPNHPFRKIVVGARSRRVSELVKGVSERLQESKDTQKAEKREPLKGVPKQVSKDMYSQKAEKLFGDASFISDKRLSPEQKVMLIEAKKRGVPVEYINNPEYSNDVMCFYADNIVSEELAKDCSRFLQNPKLSLEQVQELYQCASVGIDYSDICDENLSPSDMSIIRSRRYMQMWGDLETVPPVDEELIDKCLSYAEVVRMNR